MPGALRMGLIVGVSIVLGISALLSTQFAAKHDFAPVLHACNHHHHPNPNPDATTTAAAAAAATTTDKQLWLQEHGFHRYESYLGGNVACIMTQFVHRLLYEIEDHNVDAKTLQKGNKKTEHAPTYRILGCGAWLLRLSLFFPAYALISAEANGGSNHGGGVGRGGWVQSPTFVLLLSQLLGASAIFSLIWLPSYVVSDRGMVTSPNRPSDKAAAAARKQISRANASMASMLVMAAAAGIVLLWRPVPSKEWTVSAAIAGGPALVAVPLAIGALFDLPYHKLFRAQTPAASSFQASEKWVSCYGMAGALSFCCWSVVLFGAFSTYAIHFKKLGSDVGASTGFVHFVLADAAGLLVGMFLYVAYHSLYAAFEVVWQAVIFGPGAAVAMALAQLEHAKAALPSASPSGVGSKARAAPRPIAGQDKKKVS
jgi:hypothetical protein